MRAPADTKQAKSCLRWIGLLRFLLALAAMGIGTGIGAATRPLATVVYEIVGTQLTASPAQLAVPKGIPGSILVNLAVGSDPKLASETIVEATLRGPSFPARKLVGKPNQPLLLPILNLVGDYSLDNIRLVDEATGQVRIEAVPSTVPVHVFEEILVSKVVSRPLSLQEIQEKGIIIDQENFRVVEFEVNFALQSGQTHKVRFPVVSPDFTQSTEIIPEAELRKRLAAAQELSEEVQQITRLEDSLPEEFKASGLNIQVKGVNFERVTIDPEKGARLQLPPIAGVMVIPGNIGYLNQFFSVQIFTENGAPRGSGLSVFDVEAELKLPLGKDGISGVDYANPGDDPVRFARIGPNKEVQSRLTIVGPEDKRRFQPGEAGSAEFLVEGLQEGLHPLEIELVADMEGLAAGIVQVTGKAAGSVLVRNPKFSMSFSHPKKVRFGETYEAGVTLVNTSDGVANLVSVTLKGAAISGGVLESEETVQLGTIESGGSATARFRIRAQRTGFVRFGNLTTGEDSVQGRFAFTMGIDERGVELSPDTLALPDLVTNLPSALLSAADRVLGQALGVSTAGRLPPGVKRIPKSVITRKALELTEAGQRCFYGDRKDRVLADLALDWLGGRNPNEGFEQIVRETEAGREFREALMAALSEASLEADGTTRLLARAADMAGRGESWILAGAGNASLVPEYATTTGTVSLDTSTVGQSAGFRGVDGHWLISKASAGRLRWRAVHEAEGVELAVVEIGSDGVGRSVRWRVDTVSEGACFEYDVSGDGTELAMTAACGEVALRNFVGAESTVHERPPEVLSVVQDLTPELLRPNPHCSPGEARNYGHVLALLFSKPMEQSRVNLPDAYVLDSGAKAVGVQIQQGGRVCLISMEEPVSGILPRSLSVNGVTDWHGVPVGHGPYPLDSSFREGVALRGSVLRGDGSPAGNVPVTVTLYDRMPNGSGGCDTVVSRISQKYTDSNGQFAFDFVHGGIQCTVAAVDTGGLAYDTVETLLKNFSGDAFSREKMLAQLAQSNVLATAGIPTSEAAVALAEGLDRAVWDETFDFNGPRAGKEHVIGLRFRGRGTVAGQVVQADGVTPVSGAAVNLYPDPDSREQGRGVFADANGRFQFNGVPLGYFSVKVETSQRHFRTIAGLLTTPRERQEVLVALTAPKVEELVRTSIRGRVFETNNTIGAVAAKVFIIQGGRAIAVTETDENGLWEVPGLPVGGYGVRALSQDRRKKAEGSMTAVAGTPTFLNLAFPALGRVIGRVEDSSGKAVAQALVAGGRQLVRTDEDGFFALEDMPVGARGIQAGLEGNRAPGGFPRLGKASVEVFSGQESYVVVRLNSVGKVFGTVRGANGVPRVDEVVSIPVDGGFAWVRTDSQGRFTFFNMPPGSYRVVAPGPPVAAEDLARSTESQEGEDQMLAALGAVLNHQQRVDANGRIAADRGVGAFGFADVRIQADGDIAIADIVYVPTGSVSGVVQNHQGMPIGADMLFRGIGVQLDGRLGLLPRAQFRSDPITGEFRIDHVAVGPWTIEAGTPFYPILRISGSSSLDETDISGLVLRFNQVLDNQGFLIGSVRLPDGSPAGEGVIIRIPQLGGNYEIRTTADGTFDTARKIPQAGYAIEALDPTSGLRGKVFASVRAGQTNVAVVDLLGKGSITIRVLLNNGQPAQGATVSLDQSAYPYERFLDLKTDTNGELRVTNLFEGQYSVGVSFNPGSTILRARIAVGVPKGSEGVGEVRLGPSGNIRGIFLDQEGRPIVSGRVAIGSIAELSTDVNGRFFLDGVSMGTYRVVGRDAVTGRPGLGSVTVSTDGQIAEVTVVELPMGELEGLVYQTGMVDPIAGLTVCLNQNSGLVGPRCATTGPDGGYFFPGVLPGNYFLSAGGPTGGAAASGTFPNYSTNLWVNLFLPRERAVGTMTVTVYEPDGVTPPARARVFGPTGTIETGPDGRIRLGGLAMGSYTFQARSLVPGSLNSFARTNVALVESDSPDAPGFASFAVEHFADLPTFVGELRVPTDAVSQYIRDFLPATTTARIDRFSNTESERGELAAMLAADLDRLLEVREFYRDARFRGVALSEAAFGYLQKPSTGVDLRRRNLLLLRDVYPRQITRNFAQGRLVLSGVGRIEGQLVGSDGVTPITGGSVRYASGLTVFGAVGKGPVLTDSGGRFVFDDVPLANYSLSGKFEALASGYTGGISAANEVQRPTMRLGDSGSVVGRLVRADGITPVPDTSVVLNFKAPSGADGVSFDVTDNAGAFVFQGIPVGSFRFLASRLDVFGLIYSDSILTENGQVLDLSDVALDEDYPDVLSISPADGEIDVSTRTPIEIVFDEAMKPSSIRTAGVVLRGPDGTVAYNHELIANSEGPARVLRLIPKAPLRSLSQYQVILRDGTQLVLGSGGGPSLTGPTDLVDRHLVFSRVVSFTTRDDDPPRLVSVFPTNGAVQIDPVSVPRLTFSEPIQLQGVDAVLSGPNGTISGSVAIGLNGMALVFSSEQPLPVNTALTWVVRGVRDTAGNELTVPEVRTTFATLDTLGPSIASLGLAGSAAPVAGASVIVEAGLEVPESSVSVRFSADLDSLGVVSRPPFRVPLKLPGEGAVTLRAIATDRYGNDGMIAERRIEVVPNRPPNVELALNSPASGPLRPNQNFSIRVLATDDVGVTNLTLVGLGTVVAVHQQANGNPTTLNFRVPGNAVVGGLFQFRAQASDALGLKSTEAMLDLDLVDSVAPTVVFESPAVGTIIDPRLPLEVLVRVTDNSRRATVRLTGTTSGWNGETTSEVVLEPGVPSSHRMVLSLEGIPAAATTLSLGGTVTDGSGNLANIPIRVLNLLDLVAPRFLGFVPENGTTGSSLWIPWVEVRFGEAVLESSLVDRIRWQADDGSNVPFTVETVGSSRRLRPTQVLAPGTIYQLRIRPGITDVAGNLLVDSQGNPLGDEGVLGTFRTAGLVGVDPVPDQAVFTGAPLRFRVEYERGFGANYFRFRINEGAEVQVPVDGTGVVTANVMVPASAESVVARITASDTVTFGRVHAFPPIPLRIAGNAQQPVVSLTRGVPTEGSVLPRQEFRLVARATDDETVAQMVVQGTGALSFQNTYPNGSEVTLSLTMPASAAPGSVLSVQSWAVDNRGVTSVVQRLTIDVGTPPPLPPLGSIAYTRGTGMNASVWVFDPVSGVDRRLTAGDLGRVAPDGRNVVFRRWIEGGTRLFVHDVELDSSRAVLDGLAGESGAVWQRGSEEILQATPTTFRTLHLSAGLRSTVEFPELAGNSGLELHPHEARLVYSRTGQGLWLVELDGRHPRRIPSTDAGDTAPAWSPDGHWIVFRDVNRLMKIQPDGVGRTVLWEFGAGEALLGPPHWMGDSQNAIFAADLGSVVGLFRLATDGSGTPVRLPTTDGEAITAVSGLRLDILPDPAPRLVQSTPPDGARVSMWLKELSFQFSEDLRADSVIVDRFDVRRSGGESLSFGVEVLGSRVRLGWAERLAPGEMYEARVLPGIWDRTGQVWVDDLGQAIAPEGQRVSFTTARVMTVLPEDGQSVAAGSTVQVRVEYETGFGVAYFRLILNDEVASIDSVPPGATIYSRQVVLPEGARSAVLRIEASDDATFTRPYRVADRVLDVSPSLTIEDSRRLEGDSGELSTTFPVTLSWPVSEEVRVEYLTVGGSATSPGDFLQTTGVLVFPPGTTRQDVTVRVIADEIFEENESFQVLLRNPVRALIRDGSAVGTLDNDDEAPRIEVADVRVQEANTTSRTASFVVKQVGASQSSSQVSYLTADATAQAGVDYQAAGGTIQFLGGIAQQSRTVDVIILGDTLAEPNETFYLNLFNASVATLDRFQAVGTIEDDDSGSGTLHHFELSAVASPQVVGQPFRLKVVARDAEGTLVSSFEGTVAVSLKAYREGTTEVVPGVSPETLSGFVGGVWEGDVSFSQSAASVFLRVDDGADHRGESEVFRVIQQNDLSLTVAPPPEVVNVGELLTITMTVSTTGPDRLSDVRLTHRLSGGVHFVDAVSSQGSIRREGDLVIGELGDLPAQSSPMIVIRVRPHTEGMQTNVVSISHALADPDPGNNTVELVTRVPHPNSFRILELQTTGSQVVETFGRIGNENNFVGWDGSLAVTDSEVIYTGAGRSAWSPLEDLGVGTGLTARHDTLVSDLKSGVVYEFGIGASPIRSSSDQTATTLIPFDPVHDGPAGPPVELSRSVVLSGTAGFFSGHGEVGLWDGSRLFRIEATTGVVKDLGAVSGAFSDARRTRRGQFWGVIEHTGEESGWVYAANDSRRIRRLRFPYGTSESVQVFNNISDMATLTVVPSLGRWYFQHSGRSQFGGGDSSLGYADARIEVGDVRLTDDLTIEGRVVTSPVLLDQTAEMEFVVRNRGEGTARQVVLLSSLPSGLVYVGGGVSQGTQHADGNRWTVELGDLGPLGEASIHLHVRPETPGNVSIEALVSGSGQETYLGNNRLILGMQVDRPSLSVEDASGAEGDSGSKEIPFVIRLSSALRRAISVTYTLGFPGAPGWAVPSDFVGPLQRSVTFEPGETSKVASILVAGDDWYEGDESFLVTLRDFPSTATVTRDRATGTILNDDPVPAVSVGDAADVEGHSTGSSFSFKVELSNPSADEVRMRYDTVDGTAIGGLDYRSAAGTLVFAPGERTKLISVSIIPDSVLEPDETFTMVLSEISGGTLADQEGIGTIVNDDSEMHHFTFPLPIPIAFAEADFGVLLWAENESGGQVGNFAGFASLGAEVRLRVSGRFLQDFDNYPEAGGGSALGETTGYEFVPSSDLLVTHFRTKNGVKASLWRVSDGSKVMEQTIAPTFGVWTEIPLTRPTLLAAGVRYRYGVWTGPNGRSFWGTADQGAIAPLSFADGQIDRGYSEPGDNYPTRSAGLRLPLVDLIYETERRIPQTIVPTRIGPFQDGSWTGTARLTDAADNVVVTVDDGEGHVGTSMPFDVVRADDLELRMTASLDTAQVGENVAYILRVRNPGPGVATAVKVRHRLPDGVHFVSVIQDPWECFNEGAETVCDLGDLEAGTSVEIRVEGQIAADSVLRSTAFVERGETDANPANDSASVVTRVRRSSTSAFRVANLNTVPLGLVDTRSLAGNAQTAIAVSATKLFVTGTGETIRYNLGDIEDGMSVGTRYEAMVSDLKARRAYVLMNGASPMPTGGTVTALVALDDATGGLSSERVELSQPIALGTGWGLFSGYGQVFLVTTSRTYRVALPSGEVQVAGPRPYVGDSNSRHGIAEHSGDEVWLWWANNFGIRRSRVRDGDQNATVAFGNSGGLSLIAAPWLGRWYTLHPGPSAFAASGRVLGYANAQFEVMEPRYDNDLAVTVDPSLVAGNVGVPLVYRVSVTNSGPLEARGVRLVCRLPGGVPVTSVTSDMGSVQQSDGGITLDLDSLAAGDRMTMEITVVPGNLGALVFRSELSRNERDAYLPNNTVETVTEVLRHRIEVSDASVVEGNEVGGTVGFTVSIAHAASETIAVDYATEPDTAGVGTDFQAVSGRLEFAPGETVKVVEVSVLGETMHESDERFRLVLGQPTANAAVGRARAVGTITNDDPVPSLIVEDTATAEENEGAPLFRVPVRLGNARDISTSVKYVTVDGLARQPEDYYSNIGVLSFPPGTTEQWVAVQIRGDLIPESTEQFSLRFTEPVGLTIPDSELVVTITDTDGMAGVVDRFGIEPLGGNPTAGAPFMFTVQALDAAGTVVSTFGGRAGLHAEYSRRWMLDDSTAAQTGGFDNWVWGISFTPRVDLTVTHFRHLRGSRIRLWRRSDRALLATEFPINAPWPRFEWRETKLTSPVNLSAGVEYVLGLNDVQVFRRPAGNWSFPVDFGAGVITGSGLIGSEGIPPTPAGAEMVLVDMRFQAGGFEAEPAELSGFENGVWSGPLTLQRPMTGAYLVVSDDVGHRGVLGPVDVNDATGDSTEDSGQTESRTAGALKAGDASRSKPVLEVRRLGGMESLGSGRGPEVSDSPGRFRLELSWTDSKSGLGRLEMSTDLQHWEPYQGPVAIRPDGVRYVEVPLDGRARLYRLRLDGLKTWGRKAD